MTINSIYDRYNLSYRKYLKLPTHAVECRLKMNMVENPQLIISLDHNKNHPSIRNYSHIPFNN